MLLSLKYDASIHNKVYLCSVVIKIKNKLSYYVVKRFGFLINRFLIGHYVNDNHRVILISNKTNEIHLFENNSKK
jgi:hypothetical protein